MITSIDSIRSMSPARQMPAEAQMPAVTPGFGSLQSFELMQRAAKLLSNSTLVPAQYRSVIEKTDRYGQVTDRRENPNAIPNCVVALNMSHRMHADPLMVMQNLYIVEGRPSWSSQWIIAAINGSGKFSPLRFDIKDAGKKKVIRTEFVWEEGANGRKQRTEKQIEVVINDKVCVAWAIEKGTNERLESPPVSIELAVQEGWYTKNGSKWQTMPEVMLRYRTASFFGKLYAPELLMGLQSVEEMQDVVIDMNPDGTVAGMFSDPSINQAREVSISDLGHSPVEEMIADVDARQNAAPDHPGVTFETVKKSLESASDRDLLDVAADLIGEIQSEEERAALVAIYQQRVEELSAPQTRSKPKTQAQGQGQMSIE